MDYEIKIETRLPILTFQNLSFSEMSKLLGLEFKKISIYGAEDQYESNQLFIDAMTVTTDDQISRNQTVEFDLTHGPFDRKYFYAEGYRPATWRELMALLIGWENKYNLIEKYPVRTMITIPDSKEKVDYELQINSWEYTVRMEVSNLSRLNISGSAWRLRIKL